MSETTTEQLAEIEGQGDTVQVREGRWRTRSGEVRNIRPCEPLRGAYYVWPWTDGVMTFQDNGLHQGSKESPNDLVEYLGPIEPDKTQELPDKTQELETKTQELPEYTPPEGWRVLQVGEVLEGEDWLIDPRTGNRRPTLRLGRKVEDQIYIRRIEPEPDRIITPDDVAAEALAGVWDQAKAERQIAELQAQVNFLKGREVTLGTRLQDEKAVSTKRLEQIQELRSEVSQVHRQWGDSRWRVEELEQKLAEAQPQPVHQQAMIDAQAKTIARLNSEIHELNIDIKELETQLEAVKVELAQVSRDRYALQIELDAREQVPEAVSDRFDQGFEQGTSRAVETIAEWTEPFRTCGSQALAYHVMQNLPHIMRSLTGLADED